MGLAELIGTLEARYRDKPRGTLARLLLIGIAVMLLAVLGAGTLIWNLAPDDEEGLALDFPTAPPKWKGAASDGRDSSGLVFVSGGPMEARPEPGAPVDLSKIETPQVPELEGPDVPTSPNALAQAEKAKRGLKDAEWGSGRGGWGAGGAAGSGPGAGAGAGGGAAEGGASSKDPVSALLARAPLSPASGSRTSNSPLSAQAWSRKIAAMGRWLTQAASSGRGRSSQAIFERNPESRSGGAASGGSSSRGMPLFSSDTGPTGMTSGGSGSGSSSGSSSGGAASGGSSSSSGESSGSGGSSGSSGSGGSSGGGSGSSGSGGSSGSSGSSGTSQETLRDLRTLRAKLEELRVSMQNASIRPARRSIGNMAEAARARSEAGRQKAIEVREKSVVIWEYMNLKKAEVPEAEGLETAGARFFTEWTAHDGPMMGFYWSLWGMEDARTCVNITDPPKLLACFNAYATRGLATGLRDSRRKLIMFADEVEADAESRQARQAVVDRRDAILAEIASYENADPPLPVPAYLRTLLVAYNESIEKWDLFIVEAKALIQQALGLVNQALDTASGFDMGGHAGAAQAQREFHRREIATPFGGYTSVLPFLFAGMDGLANGLALAKQSYEEASALSTSSDDCDQVGDPLNPPPCKNTRVKKIINGVREHIQAVVSVENAISGLDQIIAGRRPPPAPPRRDCIESGLFCRYSDSACGWGCGDCGWGGTAGNDCSKCCSGSAGRQASAACPNYALNSPTRGDIQLGFCR